jgi:hypothetical protein
LPIECWRTIFRMYADDNAHSLPALYVLPLVARKMHLEGMRLLYRRVPVLDLNRLRLLNRTLRIYDSLRPLVREAKLRSFAPQNPDSPDGYSGRSACAELFLHTVDLLKLQIEYDYAESLPDWSVDEIKERCTATRSLKLARASRHRDDNVFLEESFLRFLTHSSNLSRLQLSHFETVPGFQLPNLSAHLTCLLVGTSDLSSTDLAVRMPVLTIATV